MLLRNALSARVITSFRGSRWHIHGALVLWATLCLFVAGSAPAALAALPAPNGASDSAAISGDGRYVAYSSTASNIESADVNGLRDVFVFDRSSETTRLVSVDSNGGSANRASYDPSISADGRYITYTSLASNLVPNDTNGVADVFLFDRLTGTTSRVSVSDSGAQLPDGGDDGAVSGDGRFVAFVTRSGARPSADTCLGGDWNNTTDVYVFDRTTTRTVDSVSASTWTDHQGTCDSGSYKVTEYGSGASLRPAISTDGRYVAFESAANNFIAGDLNGARDVYVKDRVLGALSLASARHQTSAFPNSGSGFPTISGDGNYVAFQSLASNLVSGGDWNGSSDVYVRMRSTQETRWASQPSPTCGSACAPGGASYTPSVSDGGHVAYSSDNKLTSDDANGASDVFYTRFGGSASLNSIDEVGNGGQGNGPSDTPALSASADDPVIAFRTWAASLGAVAAVPRVVTHRHVFGLCLVAAAAIGAAAGTAEDEPSKLHAMRVELQTGSNTLSSVVIPDIKPISTQQVREAMSTLYATVRVEAPSYPFNRGEAGLVEAVVRISSRLGRWTPAGVCAQHFNVERSEWFVGATMYRLDVVNLRGCNLKS